MSDEASRNRVRDAVGDYYRAAHEPRQLAPFVPGETPVPVSGKVYDVEDMAILMEAVLDFWLTAGRFAAAFEKSFSDFLGTGHTSLCNSGSSANLLAVSCLTSPKLKDRRLQPGDEVITLAAGFPTTVNPILQNRLIPVFVDVSVPTYNVDASQLEAALSDRTRAVFLPHTLGNPFDLNAVATFCRQHDLWLIEDNCDALGATYEPGQENDIEPSAPRRSGATQRGEGGDPPANERRARLYTGAIGDIATFSFYPAHHITMGEGGAVTTGSGELKRLIESFRDWGRDCWCETGHNNTCQKRFDQQPGDLPFGYDHKYTYSHIGYNLKLTDMQAALGVSQLKKLPRFIEIRRRNFQILYDGLRNLEEFFILPEATPHSQPSWFGFPIAVRPEAPFTRRELICHLDRAKIDTRLLFGGNLTRQQAFRDVPHRQIGDLRNSDFVMNQVFWIGVYPGLTEEMLHYVIEKLRIYAKRTLRAGGKE
jgi:CDP-6-deoxy-D-xylo-4-hexulose-3-dehydrase